MAIRLKSILYNIYAKWFIGFIFLISIGVLFNLYLNNLDNFEGFLKDTFYETEGFKEQYVRLSHNVVELYLELIDEENIKNEFGDDDVRLSRYRRIKENLTRATSFQYLLLNRSTGEYYSNFRDNTCNDIEDCLSSFESSMQWDQTGIYFPPNSVLFDQLYTNNEYNTYNGIYSSSVSVKDVINRLQYTDWVFLTAVNPEYMEDDYIFGNDYRQFLEYKGKIGWYIFTIFLCAYCILLALIYFSVVSGKKSKEGTCHLRKIDHIPVELQFFGMLFMFIPFTLKIKDIKVASFDVQFMSTFYLIIGAVFVLLGYESMVRSIKNDVFYQRSIIYRTVKTLYRFMSLGFNDAWDKMRIMIIGVMFLLTNVIILYFGIVLVDYHHLMILLFFVGSFVTFNYMWFSYVFKFYNEIKEVIRETKSIVKGDRNKRLDVSTYETAIKTLAEDINELHNGLQTAVDEAVRGEKLKAELITNVTHDLKNPLTSITSYIDLLNYEVKRLEKMDEIKIEDFNDIKISFRNYSDVLTKKSSKLIQLIEDIIAASKASSGNLEVKLQQIDIKQFVEQCLVEKEEDLEGHHLKVVVMSDVTTPCLAFGDPNHMFRVFENLLSNAIKYSIEGTRVYINIEDINEQEIMLTMKNVSNHSLEVDIDTLTERFVRADASRTMEGFGLGLSIVDSLMSIQAGKLKLEMDGDLFKAKIILRKEVTDDSSF